MTSFGTEEEYQRFIDIHGIGAAAGTGGRFGGLKIGGSAIQGEAAAIRNIVESVVTIEEMIGISSGNSATGSVTGRPLLRFAFYKPQDLDPPRDPIFIDELQKQAVYEKFVQGLEKGYDALLKLALRYGIGIAPPAASALLMIFDSVEITEDNPITDVSAMPIYDLENNPIGISIVTSFQNGRQTHVIRDLRNNTRFLSRPYTTPESRQIEIWEFKDHVAETPDSEEDTGNESDDSSSDQDGDTGEGSDEDASDEEQDDGENENQDDGQGIILASYGNNKIQIIFEDRLIFA